MKVTSVSVDMHSGPENVRVELRGTAGAKDLDQLHRLLCHEVDFIPKRRRWYRRSA